jgi:hypothetical protein
LEKLLQGDLSCLLQTSFSSSKGLTQRQKDQSEKNVWETVKCIATSLEAKDDDFDNDLFYTLPSSPLEPISDGLEACLHAN